MWHGTRNILFPKMKSIMLIITDNGDNFSKQIPRKMSSVAEYRTRNHGRPEIDENRFIALRTFTWFLRVFELIKGKWTKAMDSNAILSSPNAYFAYLCECLVFMPDVVGCSYEFNLCIFSLLSWHSIDCPTATVQSQIGVHDSFEFVVTAARQRLLGLADDENDLHGSIVVSNKILWAIT